MQWADYLAFVPLLALVYFILGLRGLFKRDLHIRIFIGLSILTGVIRSFTTSIVYWTCFFICLLGIAIAIINHVYRGRR